jgi:hypothetical protein
VVGVGCFGSSGEGNGSAFGALVHQTEEDDDDCDDEEPVLELFVDGNYSEFSFFVEVHRGGQPLPTFELSIASC